MMFLAVSLFMFSLSSDVCFAVPSGFCACLVVFVVVIGFSLIAIAFVVSCVVCVFCDW